MSSTPSHQPDEVPLPNQPQPLSGPSGPDPLPSKATSQHPPGPNYADGYQGNLSHREAAAVRREQAALSASIQYGYGYSNSVGEGRTGSTQYYQQNSQERHNPFSARQGARPSMMPTGPSSFVSWSHPTNPNPPQIPVSMFPFLSTGSTSAFSPNTQGYTGPTFLPPSPPNQVPLFSQR